MEKIPIVLIIDVLPGAWKKHLQKKNGVDGRRLTVAGKSYVVAGKGSAFTKEVW